MPCSSLAQTVVSLCLLAGLSACADDEADTRTSGGAASSADAQGDLRVRVDIDNTPETHRRFAAVDALEAVWDPAQEVVYYATDYDYATGCPPAGTAHSIEGGDVALTLARQGSACRADIRRAVVLIEDVQVRPSSLTIAEDGRIRTVAVTEGSRAD